MLLPPQVWHPEVGIGRTGIAQNYSSKYQSHYPRLKKYISPSAIWIPQAAETWCRRTGRTTIACATAKLRKWQEIQAVVGKGCIERHRGADHGSTRTGSGSPHQEGCRLCLKSPWNDPGHSSRHGTWNTATNELVQCRNISTQFRLETQNGWAQFLLDFLIETETKSKCRISWTLWWRTKWTRRH